MDDIVLPNLEWPFQQQNHEEVVPLEKEVYEWAQKFCFVVDVDELMKDMKLTYFSTRIWNYGSYERVLAISKLNTLFCIADDHFDVACAKWTQSQCKRIIEIADNDEVVNLKGGNWLEAAFSDIWQCITHLGEKEWKQRFIDSLNIWFRTAVLELKFRNSKKIPSFVEYLTLRPFSEGAEFCFRFIEFASNKYLTIDNRSNPMFQPLLQHCRYVLFATNDLYSFRKELKNGDVMNIVMVFQKEYDLSAQDAIYKTVDFIREQLDLYLCCREQLSTLYPEQFDFYLSGLEAMMRGNYDFHIESTRYY